MTGVLGRIPSHSVRAPRPLLVTQQEEAAGGAANGNMDAEDAKDEQHVCDNN